MVDVIDVLFSTTPLETSDAEVVRFFTLQQAAFVLFDPRVSPSHCPLYLSPLGLDPLRKPPFDKIDLCAKLGYTLTTKRVRITSAKEVIQCPYLKQ
jgi:hypothetical protein